MELLKFDHLNIFFLFMYYFVQFPLLLQYRNILPWACIQFVHSRIFDLVAGYEKSFFASG